MNKFDQKRRDRTLELLTDFTKYIYGHPHERFWQALLNWSGFTFIFVSAGIARWALTMEDMHDTFNFEGKIN